MISTLCLVKPVQTFVNDDYVIDVPVMINGFNYLYEYGFGWHLTALEEVRVKNDWRIVRYWK